MADALNNLSDAAAAVIGFVGIKLSEKPANSKHPFGYGRMEYIAAFIVAFLVIEVGFSLFRSSVSRIGKPGDLSFELFPFLFLLLSVAVKLWLGEPAGRELYQSITELMWSFEGAEDVYDLIIHSYGPNRSMASARVAVSREMDIEQAHELIEQIERYVACRLGVLLVIHVDPVEVRDEYILRVRGKVTEIVEQIDPRLEIHDFCLSVEDGYTDVSFRLLVPHNYDQKRQDTVEFDILRQINRMEGRYLCVITMDKSYVADEGAEED